MAHKYFEGRVPPVDPTVDKTLQLNLEADAARAITDFEQAMDGFEFHKGLIAIWAFIGRLNKCIDVSAPWELAKRASTRKELECVIYQLLEGLRVISGLIYPVMPQTARDMQYHLGLDPDAAFYLLERIGKWKTLKPGAQLRKSKSLFPRVEMQPRVEAPRPAPRPKPSNRRCGRSSTSMRLPRSISG